MAGDTQAMWALAAGCVPDAMPWDIPRIAQKAGFLSSGMWVEPATTWSSDALSKTRLSLAETGISLIDVEVIWLEGGGQASDEHKLIVDVGLELGARNVLVVSRHKDLTTSVDQFRDICERAGDGIRICLEFGEFTNIKNLDAAQSFVESVNHPAAGILIDLMHINRAGNPLPDLESSLYPYLQACDFYQDSSEMTGMDYITAAVDGRCCLGEGEARQKDLEQICQSGKDVSLEIRSKDLRDMFPDPFARGEEIFNRCSRDKFQ
jgi:sugar phosphate isomerase/epimerase